MTRLLALLLGLCLWPVLASAALAHAALLEADPASGSVLDAMVPTINLVFSEPVSPMAFRLLEPGGGAVALSGTAADSAVSVELPEVDAPGTYFVEWHVVSEDGHPVAGTVALSLGVATKAAKPVSTDPTVRAGLWLATLLMFAGAFLGVGGAAFTAFLPRTEQRSAHGPLVLVPLLVAAIGVLASIPLHGAETLGLSSADVIDPDTWRATFATSYGSQTIGIGLGVLMSAVATRLRGAAAPALALMALVALCAALALSGHVSTAEPRWLAIAALVAHIAGFSFWIGALPKLFVSLARSSEHSRMVLVIFSRLIVYAVAVIIASGVVLAVLQLGPPSATWMSPYGTVLVAKLSVLVILFAVAAWNRFVLTKPALAGDARAVRQLRALVALEVLLVVVVLGIVATWRFTPPPRVLTQVAVAEHEAVTERADTPIRTHLHASGIMADFEVVPEVSHGKATIELYPEDTELDVRSVRILLTPPVEHAVLLSLDASNVDGELWSAEAPPLSPGRWTVVVEVRIGDFDLVKLKGAVRVK